MPATGIHGALVEIEHVRPSPALAEADHSQRSGMFASIVATSTDAIICIDTARRIVEFNQGAARMFLRAREEVLGQPIEFLIPESFRSAHARHVERYAAHGEPRRMAHDRAPVRGVRSNGEEFVAEATIARHELPGGQRLLSVIVRDLTEQSRIDAEVERRWRELFEAASEGIFIADRGGRFTDVNRAACELLGYRRDELLDRTIVDLIPADQVERLAESKQQLEAGGIHVAEWSARRKDGAYVPVEVSAKILPDGRWTAFVRDIGDRKAVEAAWRIDQQRLRVALTDSPVAAFTQDLDLRYTWIFNPPAPLSPSDVIGKTAEDFAQPALTQHLLDVKRRVIATGVPARELICNVIGGRERYFDTTYEPLRDPTGRIIGITGAGWDVTDRKRAEDEQHLFAEVSAVLSATMLDWADMLASVAPLALGMLADFCIAEIVDEHEIQRSDVVHVDPERAALCAAIRSFELDRDRPHLAFEVIRTRRPLLVDQVSPNYLASVAQSDHHLELLSALGLRSLIAVPLVSRGRLLGAYVLGSSRRDYEPDDLRIAIQLGELVAVAIDSARLHRDLGRALQARAEVLAIVAHDLRNPLNSIMLQSELLSSTLQENVPGEEGLERIRRAARRMNRLIQDLLDVVRLQAGEPLAIEMGDVAPRRLAEEIFESLQPQAAISLIELELECDADLSDLRGDHDRIVQVLDNLVGNAIKFSSRGARVVIGIHQRDGGVEFSVADTGRGIAPDEIEHLFDRFWQADRTDRRGSGLGLSVVKGIVDAHHGKIWVDTRVGAGSTFYFTLPTGSTSPPT